MTDTQEKIRALFLSALMVFSVFAGTVAFAGTAAAANEPAVTSAIEGQFNGGDDGDIELAFDRPTQAGDGDALGLVDGSGSENITVYLNGENVTSDFSLSANAKDSRYEITSDEAVAPQDDLIVNVGTVESPSTSDETDIGNITVTTTSRTISVNSSDNTIFSGEVIAFEDTTATGDNGVTLRADRDDSSDFEDFIFSGSTGANSQVYAVDTTAPDTGDTGVTYRFNFSNTPDDNFGEYTPRNLSLEASLDDESIQADEPITGEVTAADGGRDVQIELFEEGADFEDDDPVNTTTVTLSGDRQADFEIDFGDNDPGNYTVLATDNTSGVQSQTGVIEINEVPDGEASFVETEIREQRGDIVEIPISITGGTSTAGVKVGSNSAGFLLNGTVTDGNGDDEVTVLVNTVTYNVSVADTPDDEDPDEFDLKYNGSEELELPTNVLAASNYDLRVVDGDVTPENAENPGDVSTGSLVITERNTDAFRTHVAPENLFNNLDVNDDDTVDVQDIQDGIDNDTITQRGSVVAGDVLIHQVVASGLEGFINPQTQDTGANVTDAFFDNVAVNENDNGQEITLDVEQEAGNANQDASDVALNRGNTKVIAGDDQYFLITDTGAVNGLEVDSDITATLTLNGDGDDAGNNGDNRTNTVNSDFVVSAQNATGFTPTVNPVNFERFFQETEVSVDTTPEDAEVEFTTTNATVSENGTVEGETNIAPGTEVRVIASAASGVSPSFVNSNSVAVQSDGTFSAQFDFRENSAGDEYELEFETLNSDDASVSTTADGTLQAAQSTPTDTATATETAANETDTPTATETDTPTPTETATETETETDTPTPTETATETETETETETATETETETETPTETGTSTPGFTAVLGVVALLGAALVALRRQN